MAVVIGSISTALLGVASGSATKDPAAPEVRGGRAPGHSPLPALLEALPGRRAGLRAAAERLAWQPGRADPADFADQASAKPAACGPTQGRSAFLRTTNLSSLRAAAGRARPLRLHCLRAAAGRHPDVRLCGGCHRRKACFQECFSGEREQRLRSVLASCSPGLGGCARLQALPLPGPAPLQPADTRAAQRGQLSRPNCACRCHPGCRTSH